MFVKLLRHDFLRFARILPFFFISSLICGVLFAILSHFSSSEEASSMIIHSFAIICMFGCIVCGALGFFGSLLLGWIQLEKQLFRRQAHLYRTLPVSLSQIFWASFLAAWLWMILSALALWATIWLMNLTAGDNSLISNAIAVLMADSDFFLSLIPSFLAQWTFTLLCGYFCVVYGKGNMARTVLIGLAVYYLFQILFMVLIFVLIRADIFTLPVAATSMHPEDMLRPLFVWIGLCYAAGCLILAGLSAYRLHKGVDVH